MPFNDLIGGNDAGKERTATKTDGDRRTSSLRVIREEQERFTYESPAAARLRLDKECAEEADRCAKEEMNLWVSVFTIIGIAIVIVWAVIVWR